MNKIFYFTTADPKLQGDFQEVSTLIGLRNAFGDKVIDVPRKKVLYGDFSDTKRKDLHGRGFTYYSGIEDIDPELRNLRPEKDDIIIYGTVDYGVLNEVRDHGDCKNVFYIDGGDTPRIKASPCFKRECFSFESDVYETGFGIPFSEIIKIDFEGKRKLIPITSPDTDLIEKFGTKPKVHFHQTMGTYHIKDEKEYIKDIAESWFFPVTKRGGWDSLRPYQGVAYGTLVIFKDYEKKPERCSPQDFPCFSYSSVSDLEELMARLVVDNKPTEEYKDMLSAQRVWLFACGTCEARAMEIIRKIWEINGYVE